MLEQQIENLAFGQTIPRISSCIGIYISPEAIFLSEAETKGGKPAISQLLRIAVPEEAGKEQKTTAALNTDLLANPAKLAELLQPALADGRWKAKHLVVTLSQNFGLLRYFTMPAIDRRFWNVAIPAEAKKYVPLAFADLVHDYEALHLSAGKNAKLGVLFMVTPKKNVDGIKTLADKLGLTLLGVEIAPCSVERLWDFLEGTKQVGPYAQVQFDGGDARVWVSQNGWPILFREVHLGPDPKAAESRKVDLSGSIDYCKKQLGLPEIADARVCGNVPEMENWREVFSQETGLNVRMNQEPLNSFGFKTADWGGYASVGCAIQFLVPTRLKLDLTLSRKISVADMRAAKTIYSVASVLAVWFLLMAGIKYAQVAMKSGEVSKIRKQDSGVAIFQSKSPEEIQKAVEAMEERVRNMAVLIRPKIRLTRILEDLADSVLDHVWLTHIGFNVPLENPAAMSNVTTAMTLSGHAAGDDSMQEQDLAVKFRERLQSAPRFGKAFVCGAPSVQVTGNTRGAGPDSEKEREKRTSFSLECRLRKA